MVGLTESLMKLPGKMIKEMIIPIDINTPDFLSIVEGSVAYAALAGRKFKVLVSVHELN